MTRKLFHVCMATFLAGSVSGQGATDFEDGLPIELARYFAGDGTFYAELPEDFPEFTLPGSLEVLGGWSLSSIQQRVILTTDIALEEAADILARAFLEHEGWTRMESSRIAPRQVFVSRGTLPPAGEFDPIELCHDGHGRLQIDVSEQYEVVSLRRYFADVRGNAYCENERPRRARFGRPLESLPFTPHIPVLEIPGGNLSRGSSIQNQGGMAVAAYVEELDLQPGALMDHFARQLEAQGWEEDAAWSGTLSAGGHWTLEPGDGPALAAYLNVVKNPEAEFDIIFRIIPDR